MGAPLVWNRCGLVLYFMPCAVRAGPGRAVYLYEIYAFVRSYDRDRWLQWEGCVCFVCSWMHYVDVGTTASCKPINHVRIGNRRHAEARVTRVV